MNITPGTLRTLNQGFNAAFLQGFESVKPTWSLVAMEIMSNTDAENYGWIKDIAGVREWIGQRVVNNVQFETAYVKNRDWEHTIGVSANEIEDDRLGKYANLLRLQGEDLAQHPDELVWGLLKEGFSQKGLDGKNYFAADHVGYDSAGNEVAYSNTGGGAGQVWALLDLSRTWMKPLGLQMRKKAQFTQKTQPTDEHVFLTNTYLYGAHARYAGVFGFHQLAYGSKAVLDASSFVAARLAMETQHRPNGKPLPVKPTHLVTSGHNRAAAETLLNTLNLANGASNPNYKAVELMIVPWLA